MGVLIGTLVTFFIAPFIIADYLIYGTKMLSGSIKNSRYETLTKNRREPWKKLVVDKAIEADVWDMIKNQNRVKDTEKELTQILSKLPFLNMRLHTQECVICGISYTLAHMLLMAKRGKLSEHNAIFGINTSIIEQHSTVEKSGALLVFWINKQLKNHGIDKCIMQEFKDCAGINSRKIYRIKTIDDVRGALSRNYYFKWDPAVEERKRENIVD